MNEIYARRRDLVVDALREIGVRVEPPKGTIYVWAPVPEGHTSVSFAELVLEEAAVVVSPGSMYGPSGEGFFRISLTDARRADLPRRWPGCASTSRDAHPAPLERPQARFRSVHYRARSSRQVGTADSSHRCFNSAHCWRSRAHWPPTWRCSASIGAPWPRRASSCARPLRSAQALFRLPLVGDRLRDRNRRLGCCTWRRWRSPRCRWSRRPSPAASSFWPGWPSGGSAFASGFGNGWASASAPAAWPCSRRRPARPGDPSAGYSTEAMIPFEASAVGIGLLLLLSGSSGSARALQRALLGVAAGPAAGRRQRLGQGVDRNRAGRSAEHRRPLDAGGADRRGGRLLRVGSRNADGGAIPVIALTTVAANWSRSQAESSCSAIRSARTRSRWRLRPRLRRGDRRGGADAVGRCGPLPPGLRQPSRAGSSGVPIHPPRAMRGPVGVI